MNAAPRPRIKTLKIRALRGVVDLQLPLNGKGLVLQGANGLGKSSIVDALEFALVGGISHLEGTQTLSMAKHGKHVLAAEADVAVDIELNDGGSVSRTLLGNPVMKGSGAKYLGDARRGTFLLRRAQLLAFIHAEPAVRFRELAGLIGIARLDGIELALKRAADGLKGTLDADRAIGTALQNTITELTGLTAAQSDNAAVLAVVNERLVQLGRPKVASLTEGAALAVALVDPAAVDAQTRKLVAIESIQTLVAALAVKSAVLQRVGEVVTRIEAFRARGEARRAAALSAVLSESVKFMAEYAPADCPTCERPIDMPELSERIRVRQQQLQQLTEEAGALRTEIATLRAEVEGLLVGLKRLLADGPMLLPEQTTAALRRIEGVANNAAILLRDSGILGNTQLPSAGSGDYTEGVAAFADAARALTASADLIKPDEKQKATVELMSQVLRLQGAFAERAAVAARVERGAKLVLVAKRALDELVAAKNAVVVEIYNAIKADVDRFYICLHPGEPHGNIVLDVSKRASTMLWMDSYGVPQQDPRAFSSEGHLDSLGLCIFLAFANTFRGECSLLVLDDVVMSIDEGHRKRIAELLIEEGSDFQLVITTHDRVWFKELAVAAKVAGRQADFIHMRILDWTKEGGPRLDNFVPMWEEVAAKLKAGDTTGAGQATRFNFEWVLQELAERVQAKVAFQREPRYTADVLYTPVKERLAKLIPAETDPAIKAVEGSSLFANMVSHATNEADKVSKEEVEGFADAVQRLYQSCCCAGCQALMHYDQAGRSVLCRNPKCKKKTMLNTA